MEDDFYTGGFHPLPLQFAQGIQVTNDDGREKPQEQYMTSAAIGGDQEIILLQEGPDGLELPDLPIGKNDCSRH
jgi:hypothetical protein